MKFAVLSAAAALALSAGSASAATITQKISFTADNFAAYFGPLPAPIEPLSGTFLVTYDPDADQAPTSIGIQVLNLSITDLGTRFVYEQEYDSIWIGTKPQVGGGFAIQQIGDYGVLIDNLTTNPRLFYTQHYASNGGNYYSFSGTASVATVPEPQTWALLIAGFGLAGATLRRRLVAA